MQSVDDGGLVEAVDRAVAAGKAEYERLLATVELSALEIRDTATTLRQWSAPDEDGSAVLATLDAVAREASAGLEAQFDDLQAESDTINIALFGRTGVGKSSLVTAMGRLDGSRISTGASDWTTETERIPWHGIVLFDTPGINGWGRLQSRESLERTARNAVEVADLVILCFDNQNQQAEEFRKVAAWVQEYGKPSVAVLNVRNPKWRQTQPPLEANARRTVARAVREHARNIQGELSKIGLPQSLVVAVGAQWAVDALAVDPVTEIRSRVERHRSATSIDELLQRSCLPRLEWFLRELLERGAVDLRVASLRDGVRSSLSRSREDLKEASREAAQLYEVADRTISSALAVVGYPRDEDRRRRLGDRRVAPDLLTELEQLRGEPYRAPVRGELGAFVAGLLTSHLHRPRNAALNRAERLVTGAFDERRSVSENEFSRAVFRQADVDAAASRVQDEAVGFARAKLTLEFSDAAADVRFEQQKMGVPGTAGQGAGRLGRGLRAGGMVLGAGASIYALGGLAALNWWNPVGWVTGTIAATAAVIGIFGRRKAKEAERKAVAARAQSLGQARAVVHEAFDQFHASLLTQIVENIRDQASPGLRTLAIEAVGLKRALGQLVELDEMLGERIDSIPPAPSCETVVNASRIAVQERLRLPGGAPGVWQGEDWVDDDRFPVHDEPRNLEFEAAVGGRLPEIADLLSGVTDEASAAWVKTVAQAAETFPSVAEVRDAVMDAHRDRAPAVAFVGDYSTGKTSLIKRLLVEAGRPVNPELVIGGHPVTADGCRYSLDDIDLLDTPGHQSGRHGHDDAAHTALASSALAVFVYQPNVGVGDPSSARSVLNDAAAGLPLGPQSVFCLNRSDELVGDPFEDPSAFVAQVGSKTAELQQFLARTLLVDVPAQHIAVVASDPFGLVGDRQDVTREDYDAGKGWDGMPELLDWLQRGRPALLTRGRIVAQARDTCYRLSQRRTEIARRADKANARSRAILRISAALSRAWSQGDVLQQSLTAELSRIITAHAADCQRDVLEAVTRDEQNAALNRLNVMWEAPSLLEELGRFDGRSAEKIESWRDGVQSHLDRTLRSRIVTSAIPDAGSHFPSPEGSGLPDSVKVLGPLAAMVKGMGRNEVYKVGKMLGYKFRPWEAVKLGEKVAKAGAVAGLAAVALEGWAWASDERAERRRAAWRKSLANDVSDNARRVADQVINDSGSPVTYVRDLMSELQCILDELSKEKEQLDVELADARNEQHVIVRIIEAGVTLVEGVEAL